MLSALAVSAVVVSSCSWDDPGTNRYVGTVSQAISNYTDIPKPIRDALIRRTESRKYDEVVEISRDKISGKNLYSDLRDMHFGRNKICKTVSREKWKASTLERALIYCEQEHCIAIPTVCGNVSRISRNIKEEPADPPTSAGSNSLSYQVFVNDSQPQLQFEELTLSFSDLSKKEEFLPVVKKGEPPTGYLPPPYSPPPIYVVPPPIPEIPSWLMFIIGFLVICRIVAARKNNKYA